MSSDLLFSMASKCSLYSQNCYNQSNITKGDLSKVRSVYKGISGAALHVRVFQGLLCM